MDEPTSGVDPESIIHIHKTIKNIHKQGKTIFITSHNMSEIEKLSDRIAIIKNGEIVEIGSIQTIKEKYSEKIELVLKLEEPISEEDLSNAPINIVIEDGSYFVYSITDIPLFIEYLIEKKYRIYSVSYIMKQLEDIFVEI